MTEDRLLNVIPLNTLSGIDPSLVSKFARLGLESLQDLLLHLPARYEDRTKLYPIGEALPGMTVTVQGEVLNSDISFGRKRMLTCRLRDDSGVLTLRFFHFNAAMKNSLSPGQWVTVYGEIRRGQLGGEIIHPEYHVISERSQVTLAAALTPVYPHHRRRSTGYAALRHRSGPETARHHAGARAAAAGAMRRFDEPGRYLTDAAPPAAGNLSGRFSAGPSPGAAPANSRRTVGPQPQHAGGQGQGAERPGVATARR